MQAFIVWSERECYGYVMNYMDVLWLVWLHHELLEYIVNDWSTLWIEWVHYELHEYILSYLSILWIIWAHYENLENVMDYTDTLWIMSTLWITWVLYPTVIFCHCTYLPSYVASQFAYFIDRFITFVHMSLSAGTSIVLDVIFGLFFHVGSWGENN